MERERGETTRGADVVEFCFTGDKIIINVVVQTSAAGMNPLLTYIA